MFCSQCGAKVEDTAAFCNRCGNPLQSGGGAAGNLGAYSGRNVGGNPGAYSGRSAGGNLGAYFGRGIGETLLNLQAGFQRKSRQAKLIIVGAAAVPVLGSAILGSTFLTGRCLRHEWREATCTSPKICSECGKTEGEPLPHTWTAATCTSPERCSVCGETRGGASEHTWTAATCTSPERCSVCGETRGEALGHIWTAGNCTSPATCSVCGETQGEAMSHDLDSRGRCKVCGEQIGFALNMSNYENYLNVRIHSVEEKLKGKNGYYSYYSGREVTVEPIANVTFCDVSLTYEGLRMDKSKYQFTVYVGNTGYSPKMKCTEIWTMKLASVSGYIIE